MPDSIPVRMWRDFAKLNLSASWKVDVDKTVTDIALWRSVLAGWKWKDAKGKWHKKAPGIKNLLTEYERLEAAKVEKHEREESLSDSDRPWLSKRGQGDVSEMPKHPERIYF